MRLLSESVYLKSTEKFDGFHNTISCRCPVTYELENSIIPMSYASSYRKRSSNPVNSNFIGRLTLFPSI
jgi:hypothetical protein